MAYYMLVRAGIEEKRFERIEGHADRHLKVLDDPEAAQNRRIEILLRRPML
jgi:chemotaxis protein MotB